MGEIKFAVVWVLLCSLFFKINSGQGVPNEMLLNETICQLQNVSITCATDEIFAFESLDFYYHPSCEGKCCSYNSNHSTVSADDNDIKTIRRECSGRRSCSLNLTVKHFGTVGVQTPSYAVLQYYCIPGNRTTSICSKDMTLESTGLPLFLTNENYPAVTTDMSTCSCSIEVNNCSSDVTFSILDLDLYLEQETCEQNVELRNGMGDLLETLHCGDYINTSMTVGKLRSHYVQVNFINNSTENQEGLFLIGFAASEENASFSLSCPFKRETVCLQCEQSIDIPNGDMVLCDVNNTREGALANVTCDEGFEPDTPTIKCLKTGDWENATCLPKECDDTIIIPNGAGILHDVNDTKKGAKANITCHTGYLPDKLVIKCSENGKWENASCQPIDCKGFPGIQNGQYKLNDAQNTTFGAMATVQCKEGYESDLSMITCLENGEWNTSSCSIKNCGSLNNVDNGKVSHQKDATTFGTVANLVCDAGYNPSMSSIKCLSTGKWEIATCSIKDCGTPPQIKHGIVTLKEISITTYESMAEIKCQEGYQPKKEIIKCLETGLWESSSCEHSSETGGNTGTILAAVLIPVILIGLLILGFFCYKKYRRQGYLLGSTDRHESVSFKNKEILPEENQSQNTNLVFSNEIELKEENRNAEAQGEAESPKEVKNNKESNITLNKTEQDNILDKGEKQSQKSNETSGSEERSNVTAQDLIDKGEDNKTDANEDDKSQEVSEMNEISKTGQKEDIEGQDSRESDEARKGDTKEDFKNQSTDETNLVEGDPKEDDTILKASETIETNETDLNKTVNGQESKETDVTCKNDAKEDIIGQSIDGTSQKGMVESSEGGKGQESSDTSGEKTIDAKDDDE